MARRWLSALGFLLLGALTALAVEPHSARAAAAHAAPPAPLPLGENAWSESARGTIRGITVGPIESGLHPNCGYGSPPFERTLLEAKRLGASWVSLTPFARVNDLKSTG